MDGHELMLMESFTGRRFIIDLKQTEVDPDFTGKATTTNKVHHSTELHVTTDKVLDALSVTPYDPVCNRVIVQPGLFQWFDQILEFGEAVVSEPLPPYAVQDCDPNLDEHVRWSILGAYQDATTKEPAVRWIHGQPDMGYPAVPPQIVPLALVRHGAEALIEIPAEKILNIRSVHASYAPSAQYVLPPVEAKTALYDYGTDLKDGTACLVMSLGQWWYLKGGIWAPQDTSSTFDNTYYRKDITAECTRVDLPWPISVYPELMVIRDGQVMAPGDDYVLSPGAAAYITFTYILYPPQRILLIRNPFLGAAYSPESDFNLYQVFDVFVDGQTGHDAFPGSETEPFKTLQAAFDSIPISSKHGYRIHAKRLKLADKRFSNQYGQTVYGVLENRQMRWLKIDLEDNCEWNSNQLNYVYILSHTGTVVYTDVDQPVRYPIRLDHCVSYFADLQLKANVVIAGGNAAFLDVTAPYAANLTLASSSITYVSGSNLYGLSIRTSAYGRAVNSTIANLMGQSGGYLTLENSSVLTSTVVNSCYMDFSTCNLNGTGAFSFSRISCTNCLNKINASEITYAPTFFNMTQGSLLELVNCTMDYMQTNAIRATRSSVLNLRGGSIKHCMESGVYMADGCSIYAESIDISNNYAHGVQMVRNCQGEFKAVTGYANSMYGIFCQKFSSAARDGATTLTGANGPYYEEIPGGGVVAASAEDLHPSYLNQKLTVGQGLSMQTVQSGMANNFKVQVNVDVDQLNTMLSSLGRKASLIQYNTAVAAGQVVDLAITSPGTTYISAVHQRINNPVARTRVVPFTLANASLFQQMDSYVGTSISDSGLRLFYRPELGYPTNSPYWVQSKSGTIASMQAYSAGQLTGFSCVCSCPSGTSVKVGFSINGGGTWLKWSGSGWATLPGESTSAMLYNADSYLSVNSYPAAAWNALKNMPGCVNIEVGFLLMTSSSTATPTVSSYTWSFVEQGYNLDVTAQFKRYFYSTRAVFENMGVRLDPPILFTVVPVTLGTSDIAADGSVV